MVPVQKVAVGQGIAWLGGGWRNFKRDPAMWIVVTAIWFIGFIILNLIPFGAIAFWLVGPALLAGLLIAARDADEGRPIEFIHLFRGFQDSRALNGLLALGGIVVAGAMVSVIVVMIVMGGTMIAAMQGGPLAFSFATMGTSALLALLVVLAVELAVAMAVVYAVPLVIFQHIDVGEAMRASVNACVQNFLPLLVFSAIYFVLMVIAAIPFGLGLLVLMPASVGMLYASYRDTFRV